MRNTTLAVSLGLLLAGPASAVDGTGDAPSFSMSPELSSIQNNCIVQLHDGISASDVDGRARGLLARANALNASSGRPDASLKRVYKHSIKGFTLDMACDQAQAAFGDDADVESFTPDSLMSVSKGKPGGGTTTVSPQELPWSVTRVGGPVSGAGKTAWIIDTGVDTANADLQVDTGRAFSAFTDRRNAGFNDKHGHGTHVSGTVAAIDNTIDVVGVAAGATVVPVKVLDANGFGSTSDVIAGIDHVAANAAPGDCANMSLGGGVSQVLDDAVTAAAANGIFFTLAAGNDGDNADNHSPARAEGPYVYTISAVDSNDDMPYWSNFGNPPVDYAAPGVSILSLKLGGGVTTMSGTSMAAPAACGVLLVSGGAPATDGVAGNDPDGNPDPIIHR